MFDMFVHIFNCSCGQSYRLEVSPIGFHRDRLRGREDGPTGTPEGSDRVEPDPRFVSFDYAAVHGESSHDVGGHVHRLPSSEARKEEGSVHGVGNRNYRAGLRRIPERRYGTVAGAPAILDSMVDQLRELVGLIKERWNDDSRNDD